MPSPLLKSLPALVFLATCALPHGHGQDLASLLLPNRISHAPNNASLSMRTQIGDPGCEVDCGDDSCCPAGWFCDDGGCCPDGETCGPSIGGCADPKATVCLEFCCAEGTTCNGFECVSGGGNELTTKTTTHKTTATSKEDHPPTTEEPTTSNSPASVQSTTNSAASAPSDIASPPASVAEPNATAATSAADSSATGSSSAQRLHPIDLGSVAKMIVGSVGLGLVHGMWDASW
ncbi:hypothetical protein C8F01DRAFT_1352103 [Mycena amicta]|nr:hypothetical protein C8F01DRAFT_1352103 [Mycena amicta]